jgi:hypothetical protein
MTCQLSIQKLKREKTKIIILRIVHLAMSMSKLSQKSTGPQGIGSSMNAGPQIFFPLLITTIFDDNLFC